MKHVKHSDNTSPSIALLIKEQSLSKTSMETYYVSPAVEGGLKREDFISFSLAYNSSNKAPAKLIKDYLNNLLKALNSLGVTTLYCADAAYFKTLTKQRKADPHLGYVLPCALPGYEHISVILGTNHSSLFYNPNNQSNLDLSINTLVSHVSGTHKEIGTDIIHSEYYPESLQDIADTLDSLLDEPALTCDIEAFSLRHYKAGIGTITFNKDKHNGVAFDCDYEPIPYDGKFYGKQVKNEPVRSLLKKFFTEYKGKLIYHNACYDVKVLIYQLWMDDIIDHVGLNEGLEVLTRNFDDTKVITYLATNSCAGNKLSLKDVAHEFAGNYAQDEINDIRKIENSELLKYNLIDGCATWYAYEKNYPIMVHDQQEELYETLMKPSLKTIIQMELTGMPMCMQEVKRVKAELEKIFREHHDGIMKSKLITFLTEVLVKDKWEKDFKDRKEKAKNPDKIKPKDIETMTAEFNPNSGQQVAKLLHDVMGLPIIETTQSGQPATDDDTLKALRNHTDVQEYIDVIDHLRGLNGVSKILGTFIPAFEEAQLADDGIYYLFGSFNLGGTVSGRLSSSKPNLQNIPSGSTYAKLIKSCFRGNHFWLFGGADFASLEDYISALTTKDPNKLKVYLDGYDGHSLRAYSYFKKDLPDIIDTVDSINSIKTKYDKTRSKSKAPTFLLTYGGSYHGLMKNCGFSQEEALEIEKNYHELYKESDKWVESKLRQAAKDGYVEVAFGLRVRTPMLSKVIWGSKTMPHEASAEGRTAGNALGQSYGLLNCRAANEFMDRVRNSKYRYDIRICAQIHDAIYLLIKNELAIVEWANKNLTECMAWQDLPELEHDKVKIHAELDIFYPSWKDAMTIKNPNASKQELRDLTIKHIEMLKGD